jgi:hypothetical protein
MKQVYHPNAVTNVHIRKLRGVPFTKHFVEVISIRFRNRKEKKPKSLTQIAANHR